MTMFKLEYPLSLIYQKLKRPNNSLKYALLGYGLFLYFYPLLALFIILSTIIIHRNNLGSLIFENVVLIIAIIISFPLSRLFIRMGIKP